MITVKTDSIATFYAMLENRLIHTVPILVQYTTTACNFSYFEVTALTSADVGTPAMCVQLNFHRPLKEFLECEELAKDEALGACVLADRILDGMPGGTTYMPGKYEA